jgi:hypothetical protein
MSVLLSLALRQPLASAARRQCAVRVTLTCCRSPPDNCTSAPERCNALFSALHAAGLFHVWPAGEACEPGPGWGPRQQAHREGGHSQVQRGPAGANFCLPQHFTGGNFSMKNCAWCGVHSMHVSLHGYCICAWCTHRIIAFTRHQPRTTDFSCCLPPAYLPALACRCVCSCCRCVPVLPA